MKLNETEKVRNYELQLHEHEIEIEKLKRLITNLKFRIEEQKMANELNKKLHPEKEEKKRANDEGDVKTPKKVKITTEEIQESPKNNISPPIEQSQDQSQQLGVMDEDKENQEHNQYYYKESRQSNKSPRVEKANKSYHMNEYGPKQVVVSRKNVNECNQQ